MSPRFRRSLGLFCFFILTVGCHELDRKSPSGQEISVRVISKYDQSPFYARIPTRYERVLVTSTSVGLSGTRLVIPQNQELYFVEIHKPRSPALPHEIYRHDAIRLFTASDAREAYLIIKDFGDDIHPINIELRSLTYPISYSQDQDLTDQLLRKSTEELIQIDPTQLRLDLESISGARPIEVDGQSVTLANRATTENKTTARRWLEGELTSLGYTVTLHSYGTGVNLIAEKKSRSSLDEDIIMITAHLDTVMTAGADDNGSGIATALSVARALSKKDLRQTIRIVAFDEEERGLVGSAAYARHLAKMGEISKIRVINLEMTGYDSDDNGEFHAIDCNENMSNQLTQAVLSAISSVGLALRRVEACTNRSDHSSFWNYDRPAIVISQNFFGGDGNPCYHRSCDTTSKINFGYLTKLTQGVANAVYQIAD